LVKLLLLVDLRANAEGGGDRGADDEEDPDGRGPLLDDPRIPG